MDFDATARLQRRRQLSGEPEAFAGIGITGARVELVSAACRLRLIHRDVGALHQFAGILCMCRKCGDPQQHRPSVELRLLLDVLDLPRRERQQRHRQHVDEVGHRAGGTGASRDLYRVQAVRDRKQQKNRRPRKPRHGRGANREAPARPTTRAVSGRRTEDRAKHQRRPDRRQTDAGDDPVQPHPRRYSPLAPEAREPDYPHVAQRVERQPQPIADRRDRNISQMLEPEEPQPQDGRSRQPAKNGTSREHGVGTGSGALEGRDGLGC
jgi:hypothetical protein